MPCQILFAVSDGCKIARLAARHDSGKYRASNEVMEGYARQLLRLKIWSLHSHLRNKTNILRPNWFLTLYWDVKGCWSSCSFLTLRSKSSCVWVLCRWTRKGPLKFSSWFSPNFSEWHDLWDPLWDSSPRSTLPKDDTAKQTAYTAKKILFIGIVRPLFDGIDCRLCYVWGQVSTSETFSKLIVPYQIRKDLQRFERTLLTIWPGVEKDAQHDDMRLLSWSFRLFKNFKFECRNHTQLILNLLITLQRTAPKAIEKAIAETFETGTFITELFINQTLYLRNTCLVGKFLASRFFCKIFSRKFVEESILE